MGIKTRHINFEGSSDLESKIKVKYIESTSPTWIVLAMNKQVPLACYCISHNNYNVVIRYNCDSTNYIATIMDRNTLITATGNYKIAVYYTDFYDETV